MNRVLFLLLMVLWLGSFSAHAAQIEVKIDRNPVSIDDSFQLIFTASDTPDGEPDFSPLEKQFSILNRQQSTNMSWVNGQSTHKVEWVLTVMAKQTGALLIPPIAFGSDTSQPLTIAVTEQAQNNALKTDAELFLDVKATPEKPFVQSQILLTLRFFRRVQVAEARLDDLEVNDALVEKLGEDSQYATKLHGEEYAVMERKYALFPQKSGKLKIPALKLFADVVSGKRASFGNFFSQPVTKTQRISSPAIELDVQAIPPSFTAPHWLSAEQLTLEQRWSNTHLTVKVGEPLTRTLKLVAYGATVGELPELAVSSQYSGFKTYPDQPVLGEEKTVTGVIATREEKLALMANQPGQYELPALEIPWFNTKTQKTEVAHLPKTTVMVVAADGHAAAPTPPPVVAPPVAATPKPAETPVPPVAVSPAPVEEPAFWFWWAMFASAGWLITAIAWFWLARRPQTAIAQASPVADDKQDDWRVMLKQACLADDAQAAKTALLGWGKRQFGAGSLGAIAPYCEARLRDEILLLNQYLYAKQSEGWQGKKLWQYFAENKARQQVAKQTVSPLKPLHEL